MPMPNTENPTWESSVIKPRNPVRYSLNQRIVDSVLHYAWVGDDGFLYSPIFTDGKEATDYPKKNPMIPQAELSHIKRDDA